MIGPILTVSVPQAVHALRCELENVPQLGNVIAIELSNPKVRNRD